MRYCSFTYPRSVNLGDDVQSIAAEQFLPRMDGFVDRDALDRVREPTRVIMNGWFSMRKDSFPPSPAVDPLFYGFHTEQDGLLRDIDYFKKHSPIGCRDPATKKKLDSLGVWTRLDRCASILLPRPPVNRTNRIVFCDVPCSVPVPGDAIVVSHRMAGSHDSKRSRILELLGLYASARYVVTSRLHCALPCLAFNTPVVMVVGRWLNTYGALDGVLPVHLSWNDPEAVAAEVEGVKEEMRLRINRLILEKWS